MAANFHEKNEVVCIPNRSIFLFSCFFLLPFFLSFLPFVDLFDRPGIAVAHERSGARGSQALAIQTQRQRTVCYMMRLLFIYIKIESICFVCLFVCLCLLSFDISLASKPQAASDLDALYEACQQYGDHDKVVDGIFHNYLSLNYTDSMLSKVCNRPEALMDVLLMSRCVPLECYFICCCSWCCCCCCYC
jgi:hypothetical protein